MAASAPAAHGSINGTLSNTSTRDLLIGAKVELPQLGMSALTDETGRYVFTGVPAGTYELIASYIGLDTAKGSVTVTAGQWARRDFDLSTTVYTLETFVVRGEREGMAAAITAQRNADNVKNVVSMDFYGSLPNMNASELALRLPGVAGIPGEEVIEGLTIRGAGAGFNTITVDGGLLASFGASSGQTRMQTFTGSMFDSLELIKGHTPDKEAASLGGTVNLKSRSPLSMKVKRRIGYNLNMRIAPPFFPQIPMREDHRNHPLLDANYSEVFSVFGGDRNLGISMNFFYSENVFGYYQTVRDHQYIAGGPAYIWDFRMRDNYNNRKQASVNAKVEYRLSPQTKFSFNTIYNDHTEPLRLQNTIRAYSANSTGTTGTAGVLPGYTDTFEQVRASTSTNIDISGTNLNRLLRNRQFDFGGEHNFNNFEIDYHAIYGTTQYHNGGNEANLNMRLNNIGWTLDSSRSDVFPRFTQTQGLDMSNPANYRPSSNGLTTSQGEKDDNVLKELRAYVRYKVPVVYPLFLKTGVLWRDNIMKQNFTNRRRWSYIGGVPLPADPMALYSDRYDTGIRFPRWKTASFFANGRPVNPELWNADRYYTEQQKIGGLKSVTQTISATYLMAQGKFGQLGYLTGVRWERTELDGRGNVQSNPAQRSTAAEQAADPYAAAMKDWNNPRHVTGKYTNAFPSAHVFYDITPNLKARLSRSESFARPAPNNTFPSESVDNTNQRLTVNNPNLRPQIAATWDASLDYYFGKIGNLSTGFFHKTITDYFGPAVLMGTVGSGVDNGYNGQYAGYSIYKSINLGTAYVQGWEFNYQHQLTSLPGLLKTLSLSANYTLLRTHGDFGTTEVRSTGSVPGFVPRTGNLSLSWRYRDFSTRFLYNYTGTYLTSYVAGSGPGRNYYFDKRQIVNTSFTYRVRPTLSVNLNIDNIFGEPQRYFRYTAARMGTYTINSTTLTVGVSGQF
ncbi:MAG: TonB-dependent receptor [Opitutae bacterium]|nr:TonB-dependent receptor [Opitutae bacterium]